MFHFWGRNQVYFVPHVGSFLKVNFFLKCGKITPLNNTVSHVFVDSSGNVDIEKTLVFTRENTHFLPSDASASHEFAVENMLFFHVDSGHAFSCVVRPCWWCNCQKSWFVKVFLASNIQTWHKLKMCWTIKRTKNVPESRMSIGIINNHNTSLNKTKEDFSPGTRPWINVKWWLFRCLGERLASFWFSLNPSNFPYTRLILDNRNLCFG